MGNHLLAAFLGAVSVAAFYIANLALIGQLLPKTLGFFYQAIGSEVLRMIILLPVYGLFNYLLIKAFQASPTVATPVVVISATIIPCGVGLYLSGKLPGLEIALLVLLMCVLAIWMNVAMSRV